MPGGHRTHHDGGASDALGSTWRGRADERTAAAAWGGAGRRLVAHDDGGRIQRTCYDPDQKAGQGQDCFDPFHCADSLLCVPNLLNLFEPGTCIEQKILNVKVFSKVTGGIVHVTVSVDVLDGLVKGLCKGSFPEDGEAVLESLACTLEPVVIAGFELGSAKGSFQAGVFHLEGHLNLGVFQVRVTGTVDLNDSNLLLEGVLEPGTKLFGSLITLSGGVKIDTSTTPPTIELAGTLSAFGAEAEVHVDFGPLPSSPIRTTHSLLFDDFDDGDMSAWSLKQVQNGGTSVWTEADGVLRQTGGHQRTWQIQGELGWTDYDVVVRLRRLGEGRAGVVLRHNAQNDHYRVVLDSTGTDRARLIRRKDGTETELESVVLSDPFTAEEWNVLAVQARGPVITVSRGVGKPLTYTELFTVHDAHFILGDEGAPLRGRVGVVCESLSEAEFDHIRVTGPEVKLIDDFSDPDLPGWEVAKGGWSTPGGSLKGSGGHAVIVMGEAQTDYNARARIDFGPSFAGSGSGRAGLVFGYQNESQYYVLETKTGSDPVRFVQVLGGARTQVGSAGVLLIIPGRSHTFEVRVRGDRAEAYKDGYLIGTLTSATFPPAGRAGLYRHGGGSIRFDDFVVELPDGCTAGVPVESQVIDCSGDPETETVLLEDDFQDGDFNGWTVDTLSGSLPQWNVVGGSDKTLRQHLSRHTLVRRGEPHWSNYDLTARVMPESDGWIGFVFRYVSESLHYRVRLKAAGGGLTRFERCTSLLNSGSNCTVLSEAEGPTYTPGEELELTLEVRDDHFEIYRDGALLLEADNFHFALRNGVVGLYNRFNPGSRYDDVRVTLPPGCHYVSVPTLVCAGGAPSGWTMDAQAGFQVFGQTVDGTLHVQHEEGITAVDLAGKIEVEPFLDIEVSGSANTEDGITGMKGSGTLNLLEIVKINDGEVTVDQEGVDFKGDFGVFFDVLTGHADGAVHWDGSELSASLTGLEVKAFGEEAKLEDQTLSLNGFGGSHTFAFGPLAVTLSAKVTKGELELCLDAKAGEFSKDICKVFEPPSPGAVPTIPKSLAASFQKDLVCFGEDAPPKKCFELPCPPVIPCVPIPILGKTCPPKPPPCEKTEVCTPSVESDCVTVDGNVKLQLEAPYVQFEGNLSGLGLSKTVSGEVSGPNEWAFTASDTLTIQGWELADGFLAVFDTGKGPELHVNGSLSTPGGAFEADFTGEVSGSEVKLTGTLDVSIDIGATIGQLIQFVGNALDCAKETVTDLLKCGPKIIGVTLEGAEACISSLSCNVCCGFGLCVSCLPCTCETDIALECEIATDCDPLEGQGDSFDLGVYNGDVDFTLSTETGLSGEYAGEYCPPGGGKCLNDVGKGSVVLTEDEFRVCVELELELLAADLLEAASDALGVDIPAPDLSSLPDEFCLGL